MPTWIILKKYLFSTKNRVLQPIHSVALTVLSLMALPQVALADLTITPSTNSTALGSALTGQDVVITNVTVTQGTIGNQTGIFSGGTTGGAGPLLGIEDGVVLVTGDVTTADGPNQFSSLSSDGEGGPTDASLATIVSESQFDTVAIQFNVVPIGNTLSVRFVFGSEEYNEFVCTIFNDAVGIFVSGPGLAGEVNIARLDTNLANFSINEINRGVAGAAEASFPAPCNLSNSDFFVNNISLFNESINTINTTNPAEVPSSYTNVEFDGFTIPLAAQLQVQPGQTYTIKVVTADIGDTLWDGGVFIDAVDSFNLDYGDAPNSYGTSSVDQAIQLPGPARHGVSTSVYLGVTPADAEGNGVPAIFPNAANGDDAGISDEDAFSSDLTVAAGISNHTISNIPVQNSSSQNALLMGWIDFNQDGDFLDAGEQSVVNVIPGQTSADLSWSGFTSPTVGTTYARFRITTDQNLINSPSPLGPGLDGEVEDYRVAITAEPSVSSPNLLLVKRITAINGQTINPNDDTDLTQIIDEDTSSTDDPFPANNWPNNYLIGAVNAGTVKPGDEVEYTVYFLSSGDAAAEEVRICDRLQAGQTFQLGTFDSGNADIQLQLGNGTGGNIFNLTAANDGGDRAEFVLAGTDPANCFLKDSNDNGTLVIDITGTTGTPNLSELPNSTGQGDPNNSYGFFKFVTEVN